MLLVCVVCVFFFNESAATEIYTEVVVGNVRCVIENGLVLAKQICFCAHMCFFVRGVGYMLSNLVGPTES